jgi:tetratricopeptide (TPR) repeat protein
MLAAITATLLLALAAPQQDALELTNGKILKVKKIKSETYQEVVYTTTGGGESRKSSGDVIVVHHDLTSNLLNDYSAALESMQAGNFAAAAGQLGAVLSDQRLLKRKSYAWVKQHALYRQARCMFAMADTQKVAQTVDKLLADSPDTFFYAQAMMLKAEALALAEQNAEAKKVFEQLAVDVPAKGLPERWGREAELGLVLLNQSMQGKDKELKLAGLAEKNARKFPTVASRANVEIGNVMVAAKQYDKAQSFFQRIVRSGQAESTTMAAAYSGLGDCHYFRGLAIEDDLKAQRPEFRAAAVNHLRVITMYKDAVALVPRSHYYAAQALRRMNESEASKQARQLASRLKRFYGQSSWWPKLKKEWNLR